MGQQVLIEKVSSDGKVVIPERFRNLFRLKAGDDVFWQIATGGILIARVYPAPGDLLEAPKAIPEIRRRLRMFVQRMDRSESMMATLRKVRGEMYQVIQANQEWVDQV